MYYNASWSTLQKRTTGAIYSASLAVGWGGKRPFLHVVIFPKQYPNIIDSLFSVGSKRKLTTGPLWQRNNENPQSLVTIWNLTMNKSISLFWSTKDYSPWIMLGTNASLPTPANALVALIFILEPHIRTFTTLLNYKKTTIFSILAIHSNSHLFNLN